MIWTQTTVTPILDESDNIVKLIAIDSDITELKEAENEILKKNEEILAQNDELEIHRNHLEKLVKERTDELEKAKDKAEESDRLKSWPRHPGARPAHWEGSSWPGLRLPGWAPWTWNCCNPVSSSPVKAMTLTGRRSPWSIRSWQRVLLRSRPPGD